MSTRNREGMIRPHAVLGSGDLVSHLRRFTDDEGATDYVFNVIQFRSESLEASHALRPEDLRSVVKLCQVMAFTVADDGWVQPQLREELFQLASELDELTQRWTRENDGD